MRFALLCVLALLPAGCARLYPPVAEGVDAPAAGTAPPAPASGARIRVLSIEDPAYRDLAGTAPAPSQPDASERLLVLRGGTMVLDLPIRAAAAGEQGRAVLEEQVAVAEDAGSALVVRTERSGGGMEQTTLTWLPAADPDAAWRKALEPGRRVLLALPIPRARGVVVVTAVPSAPDDLRVYGPTGAETFRLKSAPASVVELRAGVGGRYVAADLAFASSPGSPDRAVWVHDVAARTAWMHSWGYGSDQEVVGWRLLGDGTLEVDTATLVLQIGPGDRVFDRRKRRGDRPS